MWRTRILANAYERVLESFRPGVTSIKPLLSTGSDRPSILQVYKDLVSRDRVGWRGVTTEQKRDLIKAFCTENRDIADQEGVSMEFYNLTRELLQRSTSSGPEIVLLAGVLDGALEMRYARYAEITALQLFSELRQYNAKKQNSFKSTVQDYSQLLNETLRLLSPHVQETRITRAVNLVTAASLSGVHIGATTASLLLSHAANTKDLMAIEKIIKSFEEGILLYYDGVKSSPIYSLAVLKAYAAVPQQSVSLRKMLETHASLHCSAEAHYGAIVEKCIEMGSEKGLKFVVKSTKGDGCLSEYMQTLKLRLLCSIGKDSEEIEKCRELVAMKTKQSITRRDVALLAYWKYIASRDPVKACEAARGIFASGQQRGSSDDLLLPTLEVYSKAGDVKGVEDLISGRRLETDCSKLIFDCYVNSRARAEKRLFPIHQVIETSISEAPEMPIPPIRVLQPLAVDFTDRNRHHRVQGQGPYQYRDHTGAGLQNVDTPVRSTADEVIEAVKCASQMQSRVDRSSTLSPPPPPSNQKEKPGSAPSGVYMAATRVDQNGVPIQRKKIPISI